MTIEDAVRVAALESTIRAEVLAEVCEVLEREAAKLRACGDTQTADYTDMLRAKISAKVMEKT